jgi:hypothetical protein
VHKNSITSNPLPGNSCGGMRGPDFRRAVGDSLGPLKESRVVFHVKQLSGEGIDGRFPRTTTARASSFPKNGMLPGFRRRFT